MRDGHELVVVIYGGYLWRWMGVIYGGRMVVISYFVNIMEVLKSLKQQH